MPTPALDQVSQLIALGRHKEAEDLLTRALRLRPRDAALHAILCDVLCYQGDLVRAEYNIRRAVALEPRSAAYHHVLGEVLLAARKYGEAAGPLRTAVELAGGGPGTVFHHADALYRHGRFAEAAAVAEAGLARTPGYPGLLGMRATSLMQSGRADLALPVLREAAALHPENLDIAERLAVVLNYVPGVDPRETAAAHRRSGELLARATPAARRLHHSGERSPDPRQTLRVGVVSADLRLHACSFFAEALLRGLKGEGFELTVYHVGEREDERSAQLRSHTALWRHCPHDAPEQLAARIAGDRIDVLVDLSGHTDGHRLPVFARRPAPVQVTYLGYPNTTGVPGIDYRIIDSLTDPPGSDHYATERLIRLDPCFLCYQGMDHVAVQAIPPSQRADSATPGSITFGSFNSLLKINDPLITLWARTVLAVPGSRLMLKYRSLAEAEARDAIAARFAAAGLPPDRLILLPAAGRYEDHLATYHGVDIGLDSYPYHGTTTTCEALWMGVPVVTLGASPDVHAARVGISLLHAVGLPELAAPSEPEFVRTASELARGPARLAALRAGLRDRMLRSPLCDVPAFGRRLARALQEMWHERPAERPAP